MTGLLSAILAVQAEAPTLPKNATNPHFRSKYAPLDTIVETVGPILAKHGLVWTTLPGRDKHGDPALVYKLMHAETGEALQGEMPLLMEKQNAQGQGSAITYARRYALCAVLNLVADDDDDGARAAASKTTEAKPQREGVSEPQLKFIRSLVKRNKVTTRELRVLMRAAGMEIPEDGNPAALLPSLTGHQASQIIETLKDGPVPTGVSDVPGSGDDFKPDVAPAGDVPWDGEGEKP